MIAIKKTISKTVRIACKEIFIVLYVRIAYNKYVFTVHN